MLVLIYKNNLDHLLIIINYYYHSILRIPIKMPVLHKIFILKVVIISDFVYLCHMSDILY